MKTLKKYKINYSRLIFNISVLIGTCLVFNMVTSQVMGKKEFQTTEVTITSNETLWDIAKNICDSKNTLNIQNVILDIQEVNNMNNSDIYVGQIINIPVY